MRKREPFPKLPMEDFLMRTLTQAQARRFQAHAVGLDSPFASVCEAIAHLGYIQIDPIQVCGRMHDLILRNRVHDYAEGDLQSALAGPDRIGFEHYLPGQGILVALPFEAWPHLLPHLQVRRHAKRGYASRLTPEEASLATLILDTIRSQGPLGSESIAHNGRATTAWGTPARAAKIVLEKLFLHGRVLIHGRHKFRRLYDLPERVLPPAILAQPASDPATAARWFTRLRLRQRRLAALTRKDRVCLGDAIEPIAVEGFPSPLYCLKADVPLLARAATVHPPSEPRLLAPLDPLIYDRKLTARIWDFDYTWEVYTPAAKRVRGYYALPILSGDALVGHVDPKLDRASGRLLVLNRRVARGHASAPAVRALARFLGAR